MKIAIATSLLRGSNDPDPALPSPHFGMDPATYALVFGILSGISLPIGAILGIKFSPVKDSTCALMMAFGAGALLFAVTVELYGHALHQVASGDLGLHEIFTTIAGALAGGAFYLTVNQKLEQYLCDPKDDEGGKDEKDGENVSLPTAAQTDSPKMPTPRSEDGAPQTRCRGHTKALRTMAKGPQIGKEEQHSKAVAFALFLGLLVDGVPEGVLMGFLAAEGHLTPVLIISLVIANFPEAFSSASLLMQAQMSTATIVGMWTGLCLLVGCLSGLSCYLLLAAFPNFGKGGLGSELPQHVKIGISAVEGITGGAMITCIASVMLPEAFEKAGKNGPFWTQSGFLCLSGFLLSAALKALFG